MKIKKIISKTLDKIYLHREKKLFQKRQKAFVFERRIPDEFHKKLKENFRGMFPIRKNSVNYFCYCYYYQFIGEECIGCIPDYLFYGYIFNKISDLNFCKVYDNKSLYPLLYPDFVQPVLVGNVNNGIFFDSKYKKITYEEFKNLLKPNIKYFLKPSINTSGGDQIVVLNGTDYDKLDIFYKNHKNFVIQEGIKQHEEMARFSKKSVNTYRIYSMFHEDETIILSAGIRFGSGDAEIDNVCAGAALVPVDTETEIIWDYAIDFYGNRVFNANGYAFAGKKAPFLKEIVEKIKLLHPLVSKSKIAGWDFTVREDGEPLFIEHNLGLSDASFLQICSKGKPFGKYTREFQKMLFDGKKA